MSSVLPNSGYGTSEVKNQSWFSAFANRIAILSGKPITFFLALAIVVVWGITGPIFHYSDTWQLIINTGTTIVTFLMVFLIQNTQNRETLALQVKLSELIISMKGARNELARAEDAEEKDLEKIKNVQQRRAARSARQDNKNKREIA
jgi:low affinity Fe/Cu permease